MLLGIVIGLFGALIFTRVLASLLYEIGTIDLATFGSLSLLIRVVSSLAMYAPARKAIEIDPAAALRHE